MWVPGQLSMHVTCLGRFETHDFQFSCRTLHILGSTHVTVTGVTVNNDFAIPNNDGIDVDSSKQVWISGCRTTTWDDGICVKANYRVSFFMLADLLTARPMTSSAPKLSVAACSLTFYHA